MPPNLQLLRRGRAATRYTDTTVTASAPHESFDQVAELYDATRPSYPDSLISRIEDFARLDSLALLLEVGTGTGKATLAFARRGFRILGLEPGRSLARIARSRLAAFTAVQIETTSFEDWNAPSGAFDMAFVAQAFHWLSPDRVQRFARVLRRSGTLAIFGNVPTIPSGDLRGAIQRVYHQHAPTLNQRDDPAAWYGSAAGPILDELQASSMFEDIQYEAYSWERILTSGDYCRLLRTYSDHATLPAEQLSHLLAVMSDVIDDHGGNITVHYRTGLFLARAV